MALPLSEKNAVKAAAGAIGAAKRWGPGPRSVRLDSLDPAVRQAVVTLIEAARSSEKADPVSETTGTGQEARRAVGEPSRS